MNGSSGIASAAHADGEVRLRFWGVRGSIPTPGIDTTRYGGNTSCITLEAPGSDLIILDAGTGIRLLGVSLLQAKRLPLTAHLFLSHTHWDHIQGFPFFAPAFIPGNHIRVHGGLGTNAELAAVLSGQMLYRYFPVSLDQLGATIHFEHTMPGIHEFGTARVTVAQVHHPGVTVGYRFEIAGRTVAYCTDTEPHVLPAEGEAAISLADLAARPIETLPLDPAVFALAQGADVLIHDAQYTDAEYPSKIGWGHSPLSYVIRMAHATRVKRLVLFHHDPARQDPALDAFTAEARALAAAAGAAFEVDAAREGMEIVLPALARLPRVSVGAGVAAG